VCISQWAGCRPAAKTDTAKGPSYALDFSVVPQIVVAKGIGHAAGGSVDPSFKSLIQHPRLAGLVCQAIWGADWGNGETLEALPVEVYRLSQARPYSEPDLAEQKWQWLDLVYDIGQLVVPDGFAGREIKADEFILYCSTTDSTTVMYLHDEAGWTRYPTTVLYTDLADYGESIQIRSDAD